MYEREETGSGHRNCYGLQEVRLRVWGSILDENKGQYAVRINKEERALLIEYIRDRKDLTEFSFILANVPLEFGNRSEALLPCL